MISPNIPNILREVVQKKNRYFTVAPPLRPVVVKKNLVELFHKKRAWLHANFELFTLGLLSS